MLLIHSKIDEQLIQCIKCNHSFDRHEPLITQICINEHYCCPTCLNKLCQKNQNKSITCLGCNQTVRIDQHSQTPYLNLRTMIKALSKCWIFQENSLKRQARLEKQLRKLNIKNDEKDQQNLKVLQKNYKRMEQQIKYKQIQTGIKIIPSFFPNNFSWDRNNHSFFIKNRRIATLKVQGNQKGCQLITEQPLQQILTKFCFQINSYGQTEQYWPISLGIITADKNNYLTYSTRKKIMEGSISVNGNKLSEFDQNKKLFIPKNETLEVITHLAQRNIKFILKQQLLAEIQLEESWKKKQFFLFISMASKGAEVELL